MDFNYSLFLGPLLVRGNINKRIGTITTTDYWRNDVQYHKVEVATPLWLHHKTYLHVRTKEGFNTDYYLLSFR